MKKFFLLFTVLLTFSACNNKIKETIGITTPAPNEHLVQRNKSLEIPPHYELSSESKPTKKSNTKKIKKWQGFIKLAKRL